MEPPLTANKLYVLNKPNNKPNLPRNARTRYKQVIQCAPDTFMPCFTAGFILEGKQI